MTVLDELFPLWPMLAVLLFMFIFRTLVANWDCIMGKHDMEFDPTDNQWHCTKCFKKQH